MTWKYTLSAFNYPFDKWYIAVKKTNSVIVYLVYMILYFIKYDGIDISKRSNS